MIIVMYPFCVTETTINFVDERTKSKCDIHISVQSLKDGSFMLSYENIYSGDSTISKELHPLYHKSIQDDDDSMLEGLIVSGNPITYHMILCLMCDEKNNQIYDTGCRPFNDYCGEVMRALTELEF